MGLHVAVGTGLDGPDAVVYPLSEARRGALFEVEADSKVSGRLGSGNDGMLNDGIFSLVLSESVVNAGIVLTGVMDSIGSSILGSLFVPMHGIAPGGCIKSIPGILSP